MTSFIDCDIPAVITTTATSIDDELANVPAVPVTLAAATASTPNNGRKRKVTREQQRARKRLTEGMRRTRIRNAFNRLTSALVKVDSSFQAQYQARVDSSVANAKAGKPPKQGFQLFSEEDIVDKAAGALEALADDLQRYKQRARRSERETTAVASVATLRGPVVQSKTTKHDDTELGHAPHLPTPTTEPRRQISIGSSVSDGFLPSRRAVGSPAAIRPILGGTAPCSTITMASGSGRPSPPANSLIDCDPSQQDQMLMFQMNSGTGAMGQSLHLFDPNRTMTMSQTIPPPMPMPMAATHDLSSLLKAVQQQQEQSQQQQKGSFSGNNVGHPAMGW